MAQSLEGAIGSVPEDVQGHIAARILLARMLAGLSREELAAHIDVKYHQMRNYEQGESRIGAPTLFQIAIHLNRPIAWFFEGLPTSSDPAADQSDPLAEICAIAQSPDGLRLLRAISRLPDSESRRRLTDYLEALSSELDDGG